MKRVLVLAFLQDNYPASKWDKFMCNLNKLNPNLKLLTLAPEELLESVVLDKNCKMCY